MEFPDSQGDVNMQPLGVPATIAPNLESPTESLMPNGVPGEWMERRKRHLPWSEQDSDPKCSKKDCGGLPYGKMEQFSLHRSHIVPSTYFFGLHSHANIYTIIYPVSNQVQTI
jgi:hypothetical protein